MQLSDFHFELPEELIATRPVAKRSASRLLCCNSNSGTRQHAHFYELIELINPGDLLVFNDTRVIPARLYGHKTTGGQVEILVERILDKERILAQVRVSKAPGKGDELLFAEDVRLRVEGRVAQFYELKTVASHRSVLEIIEAIGHIPLPPYMHRSADESDKERYQTVYAKHKGSVAAPTAGFHFDEELMQKLAQKGVQFAYLTLHIGAGTFAPVRVENLSEHRMHAEYIDVSSVLCERIKATQQQGKRVIAVGTTSLRALETASQTGKIIPYQGDTAIFIYPGYSFQCVDALITNFHLPRSTLLMLVCAFGGYDYMMQTYREAVANAYRFYSYGDAMWITKHK